MSWMKEVSLMVDEAAALGVALELGDFKRDGNRLTIDGMDADEWLEAMTSD